MILLVSGEEFGEGIPKSKNTQNPPWKTQGG